MLIDWIITLIVMFGAVLLAASVGNDNFSRGLGILAVVVLVLYEPILVSRMGGTLGHYFTNLRVVDDRSGGNIGFARACARVVIKGVLGLYSFVILAATRRNQAVHDLLTRSTVQIRDPAKALARSIHRRAHRTCGCRPAVAVAADRRDLRLSAADGRSSISSSSAILSRPAAISDGCLEGNFCSGGERILSLVIGVGLLGIVRGLHHPGLARQTCRRARRPWSERSR